MKTIENVTLYKNKHYNAEYPNQYSIEVDTKTGKGRVINPYSGVMGMKKKSRLCKISLCGSSTGGEYDKYFHYMKVEGQIVYFKHNENLISLKNPSF